MIIVYRDFNLDKLAAATNAEEITARRQVEDIHCLLDVLKDESRKEKEIEKLLHIQDNSKYYAMDMEEIINMDDKEGGKIYA